MHFTYIKASDNVSLGKCQLVARPVVQLEPWGKGNNMGGPIAAPTLADIHTYVVHPKTRTQVSLKPNNYFTSF